ncbi:collagen alpha chain-like [Molossus molossus]|uniref:collagen alpha chain-like n=1 Tax=Molossus molossus TaxID=27622 RepID=UPI001746A797|nr:collagen alpha chain-like [Molossus molossus]
MFHKMLVIKPPDNDPEKPVQDCLEEIDIVRTARPDLKDVLLPSSDEVLFMNRTAMFWKKLGPAVCQKAVHKHVRDALPVPTSNPVHPFQPGDSVWPGGDHCRRHLSYLLSPAAGQPWAVRGGAGRTGLEGEPGRTGLEGEPGRTGLEGEPGRSGLEGEPGRSGLEGEPGRSGLEGEPGRKREPGRTGLEGEPGRTGLEGEQGSTVLRVEQGRTGLEGEPGRTGPGIASSWCDLEAGSLGQLPPRSCSGPPGALRTCSSKVGRAPIRI